MLVGDLALIGVGMAVVAWAGGLLERASEALARYHRLPPLVEGTLIAAVGSSLPELATVIVATLLHGEFELGMATIIGSAIFNLLVIPGLCCVVSGDLQASRTLARQELPFYVLSVLVLAASFVAAWLLYPLGEDTLSGEMTRWMALVPFAFYGVYLLLQRRGTVRFRRGGAGHAPARHVRPRREWLRLAVSLVGIVLAVEALVRGVLGLGEALDTPSFVWGATVVAAATSAPDAVVSLRQARAGRGETSLGNVLGSNVFDLLIAVPAGVLIAGATRVDLAIAGPLLLALLLATLLVLLLLRRGHTLSRGNGIVLLGAYALFGAAVVRDALQG